MNTQDFYNILDSLHDGFYITDIKGITVWVNEASCKRLQRKREELIGKSVYDLEKQKLFSPSITRMVLEKNEPVFFIQTFHETLQKYIVNGRIVTDEKGEPRWVVIHGRIVDQDLSYADQQNEVEAILHRYTQELRKFAVSQESNNEGKLLIGESPEFKKTLEQAEKIATVDASVLITGETGCGKNVFANYIHKLSDRYNKPFVQINCGAIPDSLLESELFGYRKGAFTGASEKGKIGLVEMAEGGTLFLDEIGEMPLHLQVKVLQLIQDKTYLPIGEVQLHVADVRIIAATNKDLQKLSEEGLFRSDLFYRLNVLAVHVAPLRERPEDVFPLLQNFVKKYNDKYKMNRTLSKEVVEKLQLYRWPGNVRELANLIERLIVMSENERIQLSDLPEHIIGKIEQPQNIIENQPLRQYIDTVEKNYILYALKKGKTTRKAAEFLDIPQSTLMRKIKKHDIQLSQYWRV
ncbi:sigma-54 interaction domain-containing protein [Bacillus sp. FJAT-42315]|uniref:sigma-54 interaction domain-containing protein n=1 Tax=Bacillus sp. FJAT-42315 TaxID=2014077 RepID=UPI000C235B7C|nr:sigma 54-interacting transcriptional regulator [Bacillus sp. FJAT-42315]